MHAPVAPPAVILGEGPPVVLLHAFPLDGRMWMRQARALADRYQVIVPDLRGFGAAYGQLNGLDEIPVDLAADDIAQLLEERKIDQAVIGGISRGGIIAMAFARRHPGRLRALILLDARAVPADEKEKQTWAQMTLALRWTGTSFVPEAMKNRLFGPTALRDQPGLIEEVNAIILSQKPDGVAAAARGMANRPDAQPWLAAIDVPTLAIAGAEDTAFVNTKAIADAVPGAAFHAIPDAGHLTNMERPEAVTGLMRDFLDGLRSTRGTAE